MPPLALELPSRWIALLRSSMQTVGEHQAIEVTTLPTALAFGAPPRVVAVFEVEPNRARFAVIGAVLEGRVHTLREVEEKRWGPYWIGSLTDAVEGEVHRRQWSRPAIPSAVQVAAEALVRI